MKLELTEDFAAQVQAIATYLEGLDGNARTIQDVLETGVGTLISQRPDIQKALFLLENPIPEGGN